MVVRVQLRHSFSLDIPNDGKQLFDLKKDPAESQDRWQQEGEIAHQMNLTLQKACCAILNTVQSDDNLPNDA